MAPSFTLYEEEQTLRSHPAIARRIVPQTTVARVLCSGTTSPGFLISQNQTDSTTKCGCVLVIVDIRHGRLIYVVVVVIVVIVVLTLTRVIKSVVTGQVPVTLKPRNTPGKEHKQTKGGTRTYHGRRNLYHRQKHIQPEIGSQPTMCQVHTGAYISLLTPGKTN